MTRYFWIQVFLILLSTSHAQVRSKPTEGLRENTPRVHALAGATVIPAPGKVIEGATIVVRDGLIEAVGGAGVRVPTDARVWDVSGLTIYPGFIEPWIDIGVADENSTKLARHWNSRVRPRAAGGGIARCTVR